MAVTLENEAETLAERYGASYRVLPVLYVNIDHLRSFVSLRRRLELTFSDGSVGVFLNASPDLEDRLKAMIAAKTEPLS